MFEPGKRSEVFISGNKAGGRTSSVPAALVATNAEARVSSRYDGAYGFTGAVSDVRIYNRALSAGEIAARAVR